MIKSILVVEDDSSLRVMIETYIKGLGYSVMSAASANEAVSLTEKNKFNLILTDKNLPGIEPGSDTGGMDLIYYAKRNLPYTDIIMMTGYATIETAIEALKIGAFDYLVKPFQLSEIQRVISRYAEYRSFLNPQGTIDLYKQIHNDAIDIINNSSVDDDNNRKKMLTQLENKIDKFFKNQKRWEEVILQQRDALSNIAMYSEQLLESACNDDECRVIIDKIIEETHIKL